MMQEPTRSRGGCTGVAGKVILRSTRGGRAGTFAAAFVLLLTLVAGCQGDPDEEVPPVDPSTTVEALPPAEEDDVPGERSDGDPTEADPTGSPETDTLPPPSTEAPDDGGTGLLDTEWEFFEAGALPLDEVPARPHLHFDAEGARLGGSTGCNRILGRYALDENELAFEAEATTRMACPSPADEVEAGILDILSRTRGYRMVEGGLELLDSDDGVIARLTALSSQPGPSSDG